MAKEMGEFEKRPMVQEAVPIPLRRRRPTGWIVATIVFAVVAVVSVSIIVVNRSAFESTNCIKGDISGWQDDNNAGNNTVKSVMTGFIDTAEFGNIYVTKNGDVYLSPVDHVVDKASSKVYVREQDYDATKLPGKYDTYTLTEDDITGLSKGLTDMVVEDHRETFNGYKLDIENVVSVFGDLKFGQSWGGYNYAFVKKDGSFDWLSIKPGYKSNGKSTKATALITKNVGNYKDVASVVRMLKNNGASVMVVFKDGGQEWLDAEQLLKLAGD